MTDRPRLDERFRQPNSHKGVLTGGGTTTFFRFYLYGFFIKSVLPWKQGEGEAATSAPALTGAIKDWNPNDPGGSRA